jgi:hypothetical protein
MRTFVARFPLPDEFKPLFEQSKSVKTVKDALQASVLFSEAKAWVTENAEAYQLYVKNVERIATARLFMMAQILRRATTALGQLTVRVIEAGSSMDDETTQVIEAAFVAVDGFRSVTPS